MTTTPTTMLTRMPMTPTAFKSFRCTDSLVPLAPQMLTSLLNCGTNLHHRFNIQSTCYTDQESSRTFPRMKPLRAHTTGTNIQWLALAPKQLYMKTWICRRPGHPMTSTHGYWAHWKTITNAACSTFQKQENTGYQVQQTCSPNTAWPLNIHPNRMSRSSLKSSKLT